MGEQENLDVVRSLYAAFGRGDVDGSSPARLLTTFDIADFQPRDFLAAGNRVVILGTGREGPRGSGRLVDFRWVRVFTLSGQGANSTVRPPRG